jgi:hypothetical protein
MPGSSSPIEIEERNPIGPDKTVVLVLLASSEEISSGLWELTLWKMLLSDVLTLLLVVLVLLLLLLLLLVVSMLLLLKLLLLLLLMLLLLVMVSMLSLLLSLSLVVKVVTALKFLLSEVRLDADKPLLLFSPLCTGPG